VLQAGEPLKPPRKEIDKLLIATTKGNLMAAGNFETEQKQQAGGNIVDIVPTAPDVRAGPMIPRQPHTPSNPGTEKK